MLSELSKGQEVAQAVSKLVNGYGSPERKAFIEAMGRDHRTLQQNFTRMTVEWFRHLATLDYDLRNEASVKLAQALLPVLDKHPLPHI